MAMPIGLGSLDYLTGEVPSFPFSNLPAIADAARRLLQGRSTEEIKSIVETLGWMQDEYFKTKQNAPAEENTSSLTALHEYIGGYDLQNYDAVPNGTEHEYFAAFALASIRYAVYHASSRQPANRLFALAYPDAPEFFDKTDKQLLVGFAIAGDAAIEAARAVEHATHMAETQRRQKEASNKRSMNAQRAAIARHAEAQDMKAYLEDWYRQNESRLAELSADAVANEGIKIVRLSHRTVSDHIRSIRRRGSGLRP